MAYKITVVSDTDSDMQPVVAALNSPMVESVQGIDTHRVWVALVAGADTAAYERLLDSDPNVMRYIEVSQ